MEWILLIISVPIFYVIGLVSFIRWIINRNKSNYDRSLYLIKAIEDLEKVIQKDPSKKVTAQLSQYKSELSENKPVASLAFELGKPKEKSPETPQTRNLENLWQNWYSDNSINLLLYIGAFLIVASASIFVSFQWEAISGTTKATLLSLLTLGFFISGLYFYRLPKIRNAGSVFTIIGALLIPFCGAAWYNFSLKEIGTPLGLVWLLTSLVSMAIYILLTIVQKNKFYSYAASISSLSLCLSFVNTYDFNKDFYILAGIFSSLIMLLSSIAVKKSLPGYREIFVKPLELTSNITLPLSLLFGLIIAIGENKLFSIEASISIFLAAFYYYLSYLLTKKSFFVALVEILFPFSVLTLAKYMNVSNEYILYLMSFLAITDMYFSYLFKKSGLTEESDASLFIGQTKLIVIFLFTYILRLEPIHQVIFSSLTSGGAIVVAHIKNKMQFEFITAFFLAVSIYVFHNNVLMMANSKYVLSIIYLLVGIAYFGITYLYKKKQDYFQTFSYTTGFFFTLALLFSLNSINYLTVNSFVISAITLIGAYLFQKYDLVYASNLFLYFCLFNILRILHTQYEFYPLAFALLYFALYATSLTLTEEWKKRYRYSSLTAALATPIVFGFYSFGDFSYYSYQRDNILEKYALVSAYAATILFALDTYVAKSRLEYFTSAIGMITLLWQVKILSISETQLYSGPLGVYFMILAYFRKLREDFSRQEVLEFVGMAFLLVPTIFQAFGDNGVMYALLLGGYSVSLIILSITLENSRYRYGAIAALVLSVLSQTYNFLFSLPRWLITGIAGLIFLAVAITLLLKRTSHPQNPES